MWPDKIREIILSECKQIVTKRVAIQIRLFCHTSWDMKHPLLHAHGWEGSVRFQDIALLKKIIFCLKNAKFQNSVFLIRKDSKLQLVLGGM